MRNRVWVWNEIGLVSFMILNSSNQTGPKTIIIEIPYFLGQQKSFRDLFEALAFFTEVSGDTIICMCFRSKKKNKNNNLYVLETVKVHP